MSQKEKALKRLQGKPKDLSWGELENVLKILGYFRRRSGKTGGSRVRFVHQTNPPIILHQPHPGNIIKQYVINDLLDQFEKEGWL
ncbi:MAG: type II toxin-antitoxin system HicA family toxin [Thermodesulfobacteriota bacterium]